MIQEEMVLWKQVVPIEAQLDKQELLEGNEVYLSLNEGQLLSDMEAYLDLDLVQRDEWDGGEYKVLPLAGRPREVQLRYYGATFGIRATMVGERESGEKYAIGDDPHPDMYPVHVEVFRVLTKDEVGKWHKHGTDVANVVHRSGVTAQGSRDTSPNLLEELVRSTVPYREVLEVTFPGSSLELSMSFVEPSMEWAEFREVLAYDFVNPDGAHTHRLSVSVMGGRTPSRSNGPNSPHGKDGYKVKINVKRLDAA